MLLRSAIAIWIARVRTSPFIASTPSHSRTPDIPVHAVGTDTAHSLLRDNVGSIRPEISRIRTLPSLLTRRSGPLGWKAGMTGMDFGPSQDVEVLASIP